MASTILKLSKELFVRGPIRFLHRRCKAEGRVLSGLGYRSTRDFLFRAFYEARKKIVGDHHYKAQSLAP